MSNKYKKWLNLPEYYRLTAGDTFELFFCGIVRCGDYTRYNIKITCKKGAYFKTKYVFTPTEDDIGEHPFSVELTNDKGDVLDTADLKLIVYPKAESPNNDIYIITVGDSLTDGGQWVSECCRRITTDGGEPKGLGLKNVNFVGTRSANYGAWYEAYGGWRFFDYNTDHLYQWFIKYVYCEHNKTQEDRHSIYTDGETLWKIEEITEGRLKLVYASYNKPLPESGVLRHVSGGLHHEDIVFSRTETAPGNPFWNTETKRVDFTGYMKKHGIPRFDICIVMLGWNSWNSDKKNICEQVHTFFRNLRAECPDCRIIFVGPHILSRDGIGVNYGCNWNYMEKVDFAMNMDEWYRDIAAQYDNVHYVNMSGQFDSEHGYPTVERPVNARSSVTEVIQSNGLHPSYEGYMMIADMIFRTLNKVIIDINKEKEETNGK